MTALLAAAPVLVVLALMLGAHWGSTRAGPVGWLVALGVGYAAFGAGADLLLISQAKGLLLSLYVLYIVWFAFALYRVVDEAGALDAIAGAVARMTSDRVMQVLVLAWVFGSFLQGVTGFGVPVAVVAPLLVNLGFPVVASVVATSIGSGWAVTFGSLGSAFYAMLAVTGIDGHVLAPASAALLGVCCFGGGIVPAWLAGGRRGLAHAAPAIAIVGTAMALAQYALATHGAWSLAAFGGGCAGLAATVALARWRRYGGTVGAVARGAAVAPPDAVARGAAVAPSRAVVPGASAPPPGAAARAMPVPVAFLAYGILVALVMLAGMTGLGDVLDRWILSVPFPETSTAHGWVNPAGPGRTISVLGHPGALIAYACGLTFAVYAALGYYGRGAGRRILRASARAAVAPTAGIVFLVGMAAAMIDSGMTFALAEALGTRAGAAYPLVAPFIAAIGAFVTGSNTNANVLFAPLQRDTAEILGLSVPLIQAAQNAGGGVGSVFAPAKIVVGVSTVGLAGQEGPALRQTLLYGLAVIAAAAVATALAVAWGG